MNSAVKKLIYALSLIPQAGIAEAVKKPVAPLVSAENPISFSYVLQILVSFFLVLGFILLMAWLMRRTGRFGHGGGQIIKIISSISLGMREKIILVEVGSVNILVGVAPGQIRTLHVLGGGVEIKNEDEGKSDSHHRGFKQLIDKFSKQ
jgi:flagellar protein FliO/FliZ